MQFSAVVAADISWTRRKRNALQMVTNGSPDSVTCKGTSGLQFGHVRCEP